MLSLPAVLAHAVSILCAPAVDFTFIDVGASAGFSGFSPAFGLVTGVAAVDFDRDGLIDVFLPTGSGTPNRLYRNLGNGQFAEIAANVNLADQTSARGALWFDYDGDGDLDLLVTHDSGTTVLSLYRHESNHTFTDVTTSAGIALGPGVPANPNAQRQSGGVSVADIDNDGYPDICHAMWNGPLRLFRNNGNGKFTDISASSGVGALLRSYWQPFFFDVNGDGWTDLLVSVDFDQNMLFINQGNRTFVDVASASGFANDMNDMGVTAGDYDNDGDMDFYVTNIYGIDPFSGQYTHNVLMRNDTSPAGVTFAEVADATGCADGGWGWGATFLDINRDGWVDIAETNGYWNWIRPSRLFLNSGAPPVGFSDVAAAAGFDDTYWGAALVALDYDRDGDQDVLQVCMEGYIRLLRTDLTGVAAARHYLTVRPRMTGPNRFAVGAVVRATAGGLTQMRHISAGTGALGQEPYEAFLGLGDAGVVDVLRIEWPDGNVSVIHDVVADRSLTLTIGLPGDLDLDGDVDNVDALVFVGCLTGPGTGTQLVVDGCSGADLNGDGDVDLADYARFAALRAD
ncbi:MAG TPA: CRTAC1 family protein [Phycisphaerae bacterium]|nr:CRTAC1 family protein [Phycisphaerales bacterium]HRX87017.1 CRTAC1 family protein [Phycisphaerae bacterium]